MTYGYYFYPFATSLFLGLGVFAVFCAVSMLFVRQSVSALLCLAGCFLSTTSLYIFVGLEYVALAYIIVYMGAILILFLFVVMLVDLQRERTDVSFFSIISTLLTVGLLAEVFFLPSSFLPQLHLLKYVPLREWVDVSLRLEYFSDPVVPFSLVFYNTYFYYFVLVGLLLFVILLGVVLILRFLMVQQARDASVFRRDTRLKLLKETGLVRTFQ